MMSEAANVHDLDEILARAQRLPSNVSFRLEFGFPMLLKSTKSVLGSINLDEKSSINGQLLLAEEGAKASDTLAAIKTIDQNLTFYSDIGLFSDRMEDKYQEIVYDTIIEKQNETTRLFESFIDRSILDMQKDSGFSVAESKNSAAVPIFQQLESVFHKSVIDQYTKQRMMLTPQAEFYAQCLTPYSTTFAANLADSIRNSSLFHINLQRPLIDTLDLINIISQAQHPYQASQKFLEAQMKNYIISEVNYNPLSAKRGGEIGFIPTIKGYLNLISHPAGSSPWAVLFYALRCGYIADACEYVTNHPQNFSEQLISALNHMKNGIPLASNDRIKLLGYYNEEIAGANSDPFKALSLSVIVKAGGFSDDSIISTFEDWMWLRLLLNGPHEMSNIIHDMGPVTDEDDANPFLGGQQYLLTGRYVEATKWFMSRKDNMAENAHLAIATHTAGLVDAEIVLPVILQKANDVFEADRITSVKYIALIKDQASRIDGLVRLVLEHSEGISLFEPFDEQAAPVSLVFKPQDQVAALNKAAKEAETRDMTSRAIRLYTLAGQHQRAELLKKRSE